MNEALEQYRTEPAGFWEALHYNGYSGYDIMEYAERRGWHAVPAWGAQGWDLGAWPLVIIYHRHKDGRYEVVEYVEGDVTAYSCPTEELRNQVTDELAFFHWRHQDREWVQGYETIEQCPPELRGPYRRK